MKNQRFEELVNSFLDKEISEAELAELSEMARSDESLKSELVQRYKLHQAMLYSMGQLTEDELRDSREADFDTIVRNPVNLVSFAAAGSLLVAAAVAVLIVGLAFLVPETDSAASDIPPAGIISDNSDANQLNVLRVLTAQEQMERFRIAESQSLEASLEPEQRSPIHLEPFVLRENSFEGTGFQLIGSDSDRAGNLPSASGAERFNRQTDHPAPVFQTMPPAERP